MSVFLSFVVTSHKNPKQLKSNLDSIRSMPLPFPFNIYVGLFEKDPFLPKNIEIAQESQADYYVLRSHSHGAAQNFVAAASNGKYIFAVADDVNLTGCADGAWGAQLQEIDEELPDGIFVTFAQHMKQRPIIPRIIYDTIGYLKCPIFYNLDWCDLWIGSIAERLDRVYALDRMKLDVFTYNQDPDFFKARQDVIRKEEELTFRQTASVRGNMADLLRTMMLPQGVTA
jgi:hypothetical protein